MALAIGLTAAAVVPLLLGEDFIVRQVARGYAPLAAAFYGTARRDDISVMLIDDRTLATAGQAWPASYRYHARLLDAMAVYKPRAVFFDIVFSNARPDASLPALITSLCNLQASGTRVYLAAQRERDGQFRLRPELEAKASQCFEKVAIEYQPDDADQMPWTYKLSDGLRVAGAARSAALAIYEDEAGALPGGAQRADLALVWGLEPAENGIAWAPSHTPAKGDPNSYCRAPMCAALETLPSSLRKHIDSEAEKPVCVFHETLYPADLATSTDSEEARLKQRLTGKFVLVGTALQGSNDRVQSPIHGRIPGVYLHAAALGNLLDDGPAYKKATPLELGVSWEHAKVWLLVLLGIGSVPAVRALKESDRGKKIVGLLRRGRSDAAPNEALKVKLQRKARETLGWVAWKTVIFVGSFLLVVALLLLGQSVLDVGFMTVIDVAVFTLAAEWFEWNSKLIAWWRDAPDAPDH